MSTEIKNPNITLTHYKDSIEFNNASNLAAKLGVNETQFDDLCKICKEFEHKIESIKAFNPHSFEDRLGELLDDDDFDDEDDEQYSYFDIYDTLEIIIYNFIEYGYCVELAYIYTLLAQRPLEHIKHKYQQLANGTPHEQEMKKFIDEVVANEVEAKMHDGYLDGYWYDYESKCKYLNDELIKAVWGCDINMIKLCLENGASCVNSLSDILWNRLWGKDYENIDEIVRLLVKNGADVNVRNDFGNVLTNAALSKSINILKFLVENGANIDGNELCSNMLSYTDEVCKYLIQFKEVQNAFIILATSYRGYESARERTIINIVNKCIKCGMDINITNDNGETTLMFACQKGYLNLVLILVAGNANINAKDKNGKTVLNYASASGNTEIIKLLLSQGAKIK